ncbi:MAG: hypothetical protein ACKVOE_04125 [Rickettsiales bacterium]
MLQALPFNLTRTMMVPKFNESAQIPVLDEAQTHLISTYVRQDKSLWKRLIQQGNYKLTADKEKYALLYQNLISSLSRHLDIPVVLKTPLDFFLFDIFDSKWEKEPSGFIHNDWNNYAKCMREFAVEADLPHYDPSHSIALVLAIELPSAGSGIELYDAFHSEEGVNGKTLLAMRHERNFVLQKYRLGEATLFCPFQYHSGHCAEEGTLKTDDSRAVLVAFLIKYNGPKQEEWHMFRMCKGATLEYGDESLYGLPEDILAPAKA